MIMLAATIVNSFFSALNSVLVLKVRRGYAIQLLTSNMDTAILLRICRILVIRTVLFDDSLIENLLGATVSLRYNDPFLCSVDELLVTI